MKNKKAQIYDPESLEKYLQFLEQYWKLFKPPAEPKKKKEYKNILL